MARSTHGFDVEGTRLMIAAERSLGSPSEDVAEMPTMLDSIRIELSG